VVELKLIREACPSDAVQIKRRVGKLRASDKIGISSSSSQGNRIHAELESPEKIRNWHGGMKVLTHFQLRSSTKAWLDGEPHWSTGNFPCFVGIKP
jgi:hypothetical protein